MVESNDPTHAPVSAIGIPQSRDEVMLETLEQLRASNASADEIEPLALAVDFNNCRVLNDDELTRCLESIEQRASQLAATEALPAATRDEMRLLVKVVRHHLHGEAIE